MNRIQPLARPSLHEELVGRLRNLVIEDELKPGEKVSETALCEAFGVSRTPLREALKVLASEGLVILQANRGARVAEVSVEELEMTFPILAALEQLAAETACEIASDAEILAIVQRHREMSAAYERKDLHSYFRANQDIHNAIIAAAKNTILEDHHRMIASRVRRVRFMVNMAEDRWAKAIEEHERIIELLEARKGKDLGALLKAHLLGKCDAFIDALRAARDA